MKLSQTGITPNKKYRARVLFDTEEIKHLMQGHVGNPRLLVEGDTATGVTFRISEHGKYKIKSTGHGRVQSNFNHDAFGAPNVRITTQVVDGKLLRDNRGPYLYYRHMPIDYVLEDRRHQAQVKTLEEAAPEFFNGAARVVEKHDTDVPPPVDTPLQQETKVQDNDNDKTHSTIDDMKQALLLFNETFAALSEKDRKRLRVLVEGNVVSVKRARVTYEDL